MSFRLRMIHNNGWNTAIVHFVYFYGIQDGFLFNFQNKKHAFCVNINPFHMEDNSQSPEYIHL
jgi:hypothetical protein